MKKELDPTKPVMAHSMNVMRVATLATLPMMTWMPSVSASFLPDEESCTKLGPGVVAEHAYWHGAIDHPIFFAASATNPSSTRDTPGDNDAASDDEGHG